MTKIFVFCADKHYLVVGVLEQRFMTLTVLRHFLPKIFRNVKLHDFGKIKNHHSSSGRKVSPETRKILEERMPGEYKVYKYAITRLRNQYNKIKNKNRR